eukprot:CAMPEP_0119385836 /NCGR_PEP_ID=MMETSP1334-20130426/93129_1 /TAXON_ID=127549 /ORGANISM="Calcidiscus leptoporus, Strain RCC1130" /LENGTH=235 /DNA_ID=CAMNT_0007407209 /DNA_START=169 /DNA_END=877 /DNA_ORIENTATION=-
MPADADEDSRRSVQPCLSEEDGAGGRGSMFRSVQAAASSIVGGTVVGAATGSIVHAAVDMYTPLLTATSGPLDAITNVADLLIGATSGLALGSLRASEAALLSNGAIRSTFNATVGKLLGAEADAAAGERALESVREGLAKLAGGDWTLRALFFLVGFDQDPAVEKIVEEAQAAQRLGSTRRSMSEIIALVFESTLEARLNDARFLIVTLAMLTILGVDGVLWLLGTAFRGGVAP